MDIFRNKVALITGASSGIGEQTAILFSTYGCSLILTGRKEDNLDDTIKQCDQNKGNEVFKMVGDVRDSKFLSELVEQGVKKFGGLDILINNAGTLHDPEGLEKMDMNNFDETIKSNLRSTIELSKLCLPHLKNSKGNIVNVSSVVGATGSAGGNLAYTVSKAGMNIFTLNTCVELAKYGVRVNAVLPGVIDTPLQKRIGISEEEFQKFQEETKKAPLGRIGTAQEVAKLIAFIASDDASFITGELIHIDGGRHALTPG